MSVYIWNLFKDLSFGYHVFHVTLDQIIKIEKAKQLYKWDYNEYIGISKNKTIFDQQIDFPNLKSLGKYTKN